MVIVVTLQEWAERELVRNEAASVCYKHGLILARPSPRSVWATVAAARRRPPEGMSQNGAELTILEKYMALPGRCLLCAAAEKGVQTP
jgi:hypothetical protein